MPTSPLVKDMEYLSIEISTNGSPIKDEYELLSVEVERRVSHTARATFSILLPKGDGENNPFVVSESKDFLPGTVVEIKAGYNSSNKTIFMGLIIGHGIQARPGERPELKLRCQAAAAKLTAGQKTAAFGEMKDSTVISSVLYEAGIKASVEASTYEHPQLIQYRMTDWDFILSRAAANGMIVYSESDKVFVRKPVASGTAELELTYGVDVFEFDGEVYAGHQFPDAIAEGWDFTNGKIVKASAKEPLVNAQGNITMEKLAGKMDLAEEQFRTTLPLPEESLKTLADAMLLQSRLAAIRGRVVFFGNASPKLNTLIKLSGFGGRFNGEALITSVRHTIGEGTWTTETGFGLPPDWSASHLGSTDYSPDEASRISGLQNGVVINLHEDPERQARIKVSIPALGTAVWARQSTLYATRGAGAFFLPEIGDEVLIGFLADDPRFAIVLGSLPGPGHESAYLAGEKNKIKALTTKAGLSLELNDEDKIFTISTPGGNTVMLSDMNNSIVIADENNNTVKLDRTGITLKSPGNIVLDAGGEITLRAKQTIEATSAAGDVALKGNSLTGLGRIGLKMSGGASAELSAGGNTTIKGAMVMIN